MNYAQALERLTKPTNKPQKNLGHRLVLRRTDEFGTEGKKEKPTIKLRYFNTDIITYHPDGGVEIDDGGYLTSQCTLQKFNEYLPRGWRLYTVDLKYSPKRVTGILSLRGDAWQHIRSMPYSKHIKFYENGRPDLEGVNQKNAAELLPKVADMTEKTVDFFLAGKCTRYPMDWERMTSFLSRDLGSREADENFEVMTLAYLDEAISPSALMRAVVERWCPVLYRDYCTLYWDEVYQYTGKPRTRKEAVEQLQFQMRGGTQHLRAPRNSKEFFDLRNTLRTVLEEFLLENLGFELFTKEERGHSRGSHW